MTEYYALSLLAVIGTAVLSNIMTLAQRDQQWRDWLANPKDWIGPDGKDFSGEKRHRRDGRGRK